MASSISPQMTAYLIGYHAARALERLSRQSRPYPKKNRGVGGEGEHISHQAIAPEKVTSGVMGTSAFFLSCAGTTS